MKTRIIILSLCLLILQGCMYTSYTHKLKSPVVRAEFQYKTRIELYSSLEDQNNGIASIGDEMFVVRKSSNQISKNETVKLKTPTDQQFPKKATWIGTHSYNDGESGDLIVYTTPSYYKGAIGVILDDKENLATAKPLVQVEGSKEGRRWRLNRRGIFFYIETHEKETLTVKPWALRYGGVTNNIYKFEITNQVESTVIEVIQTIRINEKNFLSGFTVRGVLVQGMGKDKLGVIKYTLSDITE